MSGGAQLLRNFLGLFTHTTRDSGPSLETDPLSSVSLFHLLRAKGHPLADSGLVLSASAQRLSSARIHRLKRQAPVEAVVVGVVAGFAWVASGLYATVYSPVRERRQARRVTA